MGSQITLPCMNGFTLRAEGANLVVVTRREEETIPISKIQSFSMKEPKGLSQGQIVQDGPSSDYRGQSGLWHICRPRRRKELFLHQGQPGGRKAAPGVCHRL